MSGPRTERHQIFLDELKAPLLPLVPGRKVFDLDGQPHLEQPFVDGLQVACTRVARLGSGWHTLSGIHPHGRSIRLLRTLEGHGVSVGHEAAAIGGRLRHAWPR